MDASVRGVPLAWRLAGLLCRVSSAYCGVSSATVCLAAAGLSEMLSSHRNSGVGSSSSWGGVLCALYLVVGLGCVPFARAQSRAEIPIETQIYKRVGERELSVDVFQPSSQEAGAERRPAIAFFHGGGWVFGDRTVYHEACRRYAAMGLVTLSFEYRLSRTDAGDYPHPEITPVESVKDARSAIRWMRRNAEQLQLDPDRIAAWGRSAGGQLVWATALCGGINEAGEDLSISATPDVLMTFSACYNTLNTWVERMLGEQRERIWDISPYHQLVANHPPAIGFHGREDTVEPWRVANWFREKSESLGSPFELVTVHDEGHALAGDSAPPGELSNPTILQRADAFLEAMGWMPPEG